MDQREAGPRFSSEEQALLIANTYRCLIACILPMLYLLSNYKHNNAYYVGSVFFLSTCKWYFILSLLQFFNLSKKLRQKLSFETWVIIGTFLDLGALLTLMHAAGGIVSGFGVLLIIVVTATSLLVPGQLAILSAAMASLGILAEHLLSTLTENAAPGTYTQAGLLGATSFIVAMATMRLSNKMRTSEVLLKEQRLALEKQKKLASLGRLAASIAHEIRNPLSAISQAAQLANGSHVLGEEEKRLLTIILKHSDRINKIIENVLELSRKQPVTTEYFLLKPWLLDFLEGFRQSNDAPIDCELLDTYPELKIYFNTDHLHQILVNLCVNGLRYSMQKLQQPWIRICVKLDPTPAGFVYLEVIDQGPGVDASLKELLFEPFFSTETSGSGLGLFLAKQLAELNHSQLSYCNLKNGGCAFTLSIPQGKLHDENAFGN